MGKLTEARELKEELRRLGVEINHSMLTWKAPNGFSGNVKGGRQLKRGDWICQTCEVIVFSSKGKFNCFKCGQKRPDNVEPGPTEVGRGGGGRYQSYDRDAGRRQSYDRGADRRRDDWRDRDWNDRSKRSDANSDDVD